VQRYLDEEPAVKPLALLIKYYLKQFGMNEPYTGGLGSYALIIMIISYLQVPSTPAARRLMSC
jgi:non-canonical poly(A) RNA polymerase PAPD5/7